MPLKSGLPSRKLKHTKYKLRIQRHLSRVSSHKAYFFKLPLELRNQIYEYCLVVGELNPQPLWYYEETETVRKQRKPDVALLQTCRSIYREALVIFISKNSWRLHDQLPSLLSSNEIVSNRRQFVRHVKLSFDVRAKCPMDESNKDLQTFKFANQRAEFREVTGERIHEIRTETKSNEFESMVELLFARDLCPRVVELDLENCFCPSGCCRMVYEVSTFLNVQMDNNPQFDLLRRFIFTGLLDKWEEESLTDDFLWKDEDYWMLDTSPNAYRIDLEWKLVEENDTDDGRKPPGRIVVDVKQLEIWDESMEDFTEESIEESGEESKEESRKGSIEL